MAGVSKRDRRVHLVTTVASRLMAGWAIPDAMGGMHCPNVLDAIAVAEKLIAAVEARYPKTEGETGAPDIHAVASALTFGGMDRNVGSATGAEAIAEPLEEVPSAEVAGLVTVLHGESPAVDPNEDDKALRERAIEAAGLWPSVIAQLALATGEKLTELAAHLGVRRGIP